MSRVKQFAYDVGDAFVDMLHGIRHLPADAYVFCTLLAIAQTAILALLLS